MPRRWLPATVVVLLLLLPACRDNPAIEQHRYDRWLQSGMAAGVSRYQHILDSHGVGDIVPMPVLLRGSRRWRSCGGREFLLPPADRQTAILPTLELVAELQARGFLSAQEVRSGYRDPALNRCSGGSTRSRHLANQALDFDLPDGSAQRVRALCRFWREQGAARKMGLGFYTATTIHVDTSGFRTWGSDHRRRTSLCASSSEG